MKTLTNLRAILEYYEIQNRELAQAINVSPSMVSNWVQGKRALRTSSGSVVAIADYILSKRLPTSRDITWMKKQFEQAGISTDFDSTSDIRRSLIIWLSDDGPEVLEIFKGTESIHIENEQPDLSGAQYLHSIGPAGRIYSNDYSARAGVVDISLRLGRIFETIAENVTIDICLSSETASTIIEDVFIAEIIKAFKKKGLRIRMLVALSVNSTALSRIINSYSQLIVNGNMEIYTSHGMLQPMIYQTSIFIPGTCAVSITELPDSYSPPVAVFITENQFLKDAADGFDRIVRLAQPLMRFYPESLIKNIGDLLYREFVDEGDLDILSDTVNPFVLGYKDYSEILEQQGFKASALEWRKEEFLRMKDGFENNLKSGAIFREIIPLEYIKKMVTNGSCELPSVYFMNQGKTLIGQKSCVSLLKGYVRMLEEYPNYHLAIAHQLDENEHSARHIKRNRHILLYPWKNAQPAMIYSEQMIMIHEYQTHFNDLWMRLSMGTRESTAALLGMIAKEMENT